MWSMCAKTCVLSTNVLILGSGSGILDERGQKYHSSRWGLAEHGVGLSRPNRLGASRTHPSFLVMVGNGGFGLTTNQGTQEGFGS